MTCHDFHGVLSEYLDGTLEGRHGAAARQHLHACAACRAALERAQGFAREMRPALQQAAANVKFSVDLEHRILRAARQALLPKPAPVRAWDWVAGNPFRALGIGLAAAAVVVVALQWRRSARSTERQIVTFTVDVPFHVDGQPGVSHVEYRQSSAD